MKQRHRKKRINRAQFFSVVSAERCERCGVREAHYVHAGGFFKWGFWTCPDLYDENERRKEAGRGNHPLIMHID